MTCLMITDFDCMQNCRILHSVKMRQLDGVHPRSINQLSLSRANLSCAVSAYKPSKAAYTR